MLAYIVLLLAVISRLLPPAFHTVSWNFTALGGGLLFFGSRMGNRANGSAWNVAAKLGSALVVLMATDYYLTVYAYQYPFQVRWYLVTWAWYALVCMMGLGLLQKVTMLRVAAGTLASATSFFLLSNVAVWATGTMYPRTLAGLEACLTAGIPFYRNDLVSTAITAGALFGLPVLVAKVVESMHAAQHDHIA
jgi:hypothetical protein